MSKRRRAQVIEVTSDELRQRLAHGEHDQRGNDRVAADLRFDMPLPSWDTVRRVYTQNISAGGLMFRIASPVKLPGAAEILLTLPDGQTIALASEIRHAARVEGTGEVEVGVQFVAVPPEVDAALRAALSGFRAAS